jgi:hypothetical protein
MTTADDSGGATLAALMEQLRKEGGSIVTLRALIEEASEVGAARALRKLGLEDAAAGQDLREIRTLLEAWRSAKRTAWSALVKWMLGALLVLAAMEVATQIKLLGLAR